MFILIPETPTLTETLELLGADLDNHEWIERRAGLQRKRKSPSGDRSDSPGRKPKSPKPSVSGTTVQQVLHGPIGQLQGKSIRFENDTPTLHELFCDEVLPEKIPSPVPLPEPTKVVQWGNPQTQWLEGFVGKWRVAFSYFMAWYSDNIETIQTVKTHPKVNPLRFHELYRPIQEHETLGRKLDAEITQHIRSNNFTFDLKLDLELSHAIEITLSEGHWGIWKCVDRFANYCNLVLTSHLGTQQ